MFNDLSWLIPAHIVAVSLYGGLFDPLHQFLEGHT